MYFYITPLDQHSCRVFSHALVCDPLPKPVSWLLAKRPRWLDHLVLNQARHSTCCCRSSCHSLYTPPVAADGHAMQYAQFFCSKLSRLLLEMPLRVWSSSTEFRAVSLNSIFPNAHRHCQEHGWQCVPDASVLGQQRAEALSGLSKHSPHSIARLLHFGCVTCRYLMEIWRTCIRQASLPRIKTPPWMAGHVTTSWHLKLTGALLRLHA